MSRAFIFPGQGSQFIGMGKDLAESYAEAREVFQEVDEALGQNLSKMMFAGDEADLNMTENTQPALMAVSVAVMRVLEKQGGWALADKASFVAGHSLGEYAALTAAGSFALSDAARLLKLRGQAMQKAVPVGVGSMAAIIGPSLEDVRKIAEDAAQGDVCEAANDNSVGQVVISGHKDAIARAVEIATERGAKRAVILPVSAPFHCALMQPAAVAMEEALADTAVNAPSVPVVANVTAEAVSDADQIRKLLVQQVTGAVRWRESVIWMREQGVEQMVEVGAGKVLSGLARRIDREIECFNVGASADIDAALEKLS
ncbi:MAG: ACP S-malonyltransferase [Micavibrio sp.]|nr:ACP S-malonyltransferase [Micavibrio sp.]